MHIAHMFIDGFKKCLLDPTVKATVGANAVEKKQIRESIWMHITVSGGFFYSNYKEP